MADFYAFFGKHWFLGIILLWIGYCLVTLPLRLTFRLANRFIRSRNIKNAGWPPAHLDADGDVVKVQEQ